MAGLPQYMPRLLRKEVSDFGRVSIEVQLALNSWYSIELQHVGQCSGAHLRRTDSEDPTVRTNKKYPGCFRLTQGVEVGP